MADIRLNDEIVCHYILQHNHDVPHASNTSYEFRAVQLQHHHNLNRVLTD